jgi:hypothetical protein
MFVPLLGVTHEFTVVAAPVTADPGAFVRDTVANVGPRARQRHANAQHWIAATKHQGVCALRTSPCIAVCWRPYGLHKLSTTGEGAVDVKVRTISIEKMATGRLSGTYR